MVPAGTWVTVLPPTWNKQGEMWIPTMNFLACDFQTSPPSQQADREKQCLIFLGDGVLHWLHLVFQRQGTTWNCHAFKGSKHHMTSPFSLVSLARCPGELPLLPRLADTLVDGEIYRWFVALQSYNCQPVLHQSNGVARGTSCSL